MHVYRLRPVITETRWTLNSFLIPTSFHATNPILSSVADNLARDLSDFRAARLVMDFYDVYSR